MAKKTLIQTFCESGDHQALRAARAWCGQMGLAETDTRAAAHEDRPFGNYQITRLAQQERSGRAEPRGEMVGDLKRGPVSVILTAMTAPGIEEPCTSLPQNDSPQASTGEPE